ncbi:MAG: hypothetical protein DRR08_26640 [Candidatus Parabeggiatoa sp. nov. 2]|nr:MAG: hypothetical protein B6247_18700 [Beggiatoa sp. 4572_84]RKZ54257.1 MAG: hypothetical protein DRR08_26640 [Gammaproteobacteria bacterium]
MFLVLSGEGPSDIGIQDDKIGPMTKLIDLWIIRRSGYSLIECEQYTIFRKEQLAKQAKTLKSYSGKKQKKETGYFFKNARALALLAKEESSQRNDITVIPVLFRDADGTASSGRGEWQKKWQSMLDGFEMLNGVPMIQKQKSEAWILCALREKYQNCNQLEYESGNDNSPNSLKKQLAKHLGEDATRELINKKIDEGQIDIDMIVDMPSLTQFKEQLDKVLDNLKLPKAFS